MKTSDSVLTFPKDRPRPQQSEVAKPFWDAARDKKLMRPVCTNGHNFFPPQFACPHCLTETWEWKQSTGQGAIYSYTIVHRSPAPGFDVPFALAVVDLEEGWSMLANIVNAKPGDVASGRKVRVAWMVAEDGFTLPAFEVLPETKS
jgi:uncharacterized OB-fold protein